MEEKISINYLNETFTFEDALGNTISNNYTIPTLTETVYANISINPSVGSNCLAPTKVAINLAWSTTIIPPTYLQKEVHKISSTGALTGQGQNGIESFDKSIFSDIESELILAEPFFAGKTFSFYRTQDNALNFFAKIDKSIDFTTNPSNDGFTFNVTENRWEQEIWVYIEDDITTAITTCFGLYQVGTLYIEKRPVFYDVADQELCDDAPDELDTYSVFDTSLLFDEFTINPSATLQQDPSLFDVQYSYIDDSGSAVVLDPNLPVNFNSNTQDVTVTLTNKTTNSSSPAGQSEGIIKFRVYKQPVAYPSDPTVAGIFTIEDCDDVASGADDDGETLFDITNIKDILLTDPSGTRPVQLSSDFDFVFTDGGGNPVTLTSDYRAKSGDQINVTITNPLSTLPDSCEETITIEFKVNPLPSYDMDDDTIVCLNPLPGQPVEIGTSNWNGGTDPLIYEYSWTFSGDPLFSENTPTIGVEKGGVYTVVVTDAITRCTRTKTITVTESEMASLDRDDDGNVDLTEYNYFVEKTDLTDDNTNTITIKNIADLGIGDYEFSIDDSFGPYQDDPTFENVKPGVHTIYIRDKNSYYTYDYGCGIAQVDVSIIGYKKYFTPNGDGINETWKILGINSAFNAKSKVYIFDRYGKLLKQLDPLSDGWDGTYLGKPMPATDYWFRTYLEDGREFKGHFSLIRGKF
jgi:gliding motility-associated-like protein